MKSELLLHAVELWDLESQTLLAHFESYRADSPLRLIEDLVAVSFDGSFFVTSQYQGLQLRDSRNGEVIRSLPTKHAQRAVHLGLVTRDVGRLFAVHWEPHDRVFALDMADGTVSASFVGHKGRIQAIALSPDESRLATGGVGAKLRIWDAASGRQIAWWTAHNAPITAIDFHPESDLLCSGDSDGVIKLWNLARIRRQLAEIGIEWDSESGIGKDSDATDE